VRKKKKKKMMAVALLACRLLFKQNQNKICFLFSKDPVIIFEFYNPVCITKVKVGK